MASTRLSTPLCGITAQMGRPMVRLDTFPVTFRQTSRSTAVARTLTTSRPPLASISSLLTSADAYVPTVPLERQTTHATIHHFPSLEPLRLEAYHANHLFLPTRRDILHRAVIYEGDATRLGTASTLWRDQVRGSSRKIRPQKGSGRARLGDKKSPMLRGGGVAFGPKPRDFSTELPKKVYDLAWRTALSYRFRKGELVIVDNALEIESPSPALLKYIFRKHGWGNTGGRSLLITLQDRPLLAKSLAELPKEGRILTWKEVDVKDLLELGRIIIERKALWNILFTHQDDLHPYPLPKLAELQEPGDLERIVGWSEFRELELANAVDLPHIKARLYESVANKRWIEAGTKTGPEATRLQTSAWQLRSEGYDARAESITEYTSLYRQALAKADLADTEKHPESLAYLQLQRESAFLRTQGKLLEAQRRGVEAQSREAQAEALHIQGRNARAQAWMASAEEASAVAGELLEEAHVEITGVNLARSTPGELQKADHLTDQVEQAVAEFGRPRDQATDGDGLTEEILE